jgi:hypothetical protein
VNEGRRKVPMANDLVRRVQHTEVFVRMAAIELRRMAEQAPDIAGELCHMAEQLQAEATDLARCIWDDPSVASPLDQ